MKTSVLTMKSVPKEDRPRERLLKHGASHLSNQEILSILIGSGTKQDSVNVLSNRILMLKILKLMILLN